MQPPEFLPALRQHASARENNSIPEHEIRRIPPAHTRYRGFKRIKTTFLYLCCQLSSKTTGSGGLMNDHTAASFFYRPGYGFNVQRYERTQVDNFCINTLLPGRSLCDPNHGSIGQYGYRITFSKNSRLPQGYTIFLIRNLTQFRAIPTQRRFIRVTIKRSVVQSFRLEKHDRVIGFYCSIQ